MKPLAQMACDVLTTADGHEKTALSRRYAAEWFEARAQGLAPEIGTASPPIRPARPEKPDLLDPRDVPRRKPGSPEGRIAMLHAVAHIELNAVDLHWDIIARFTDTKMPIGFYDDWVKSADEESKHFNLICDRLHAEGSHYGDCPAHAGMWQSAEETADDLMGRLAVVPMVLEARGLDVTLGREATLIRPDGRVEGIVADIDPDGGLIMLVEGSPRLYSGGELSLRVRH
ncbi:MAG: DUF455 family protein [Marivivens sp.]|nr:DUF455 family protein [Marivivens sp.]